LPFSSTPVTEASIKKEDPLEALSNHVPHQIHLLLFGDAASRGDIDPLSAANANLQSSLRKVPDLTIYVQSTNNEHERGILFLFSKLAHRMYGLTSQDFFSKEDGCYDTLGVDRAASVYCAYHCFNTPVLVLDGGTALTYTACDGKGKLMGGGISLGFLSRFRALADYCGKLPLIDFEEYEGAVAKIQNGGAETLPVFAMDTNTAMMTSVFQEISLHCHTVILHFLDELKSREAEAEKSNLAPARSETKALPKVVMAGSDSRFLETLLEKPGLVVRNAFAPSIKDQVDFRVFRNGCHYAVGKLLEINRDQMDQLTGDDELRARLVGQRVAKEFPVADAEGDVIYRGSVRQVKRGEFLEADFFTVQFDDGDNEDLDFEEIYGECGGRRC
jgi:pantothenate kinase type III